MHKEILALWTGSEMQPWVKYPGTAISCCTDAFRPVVFKLKRIEE